MAYGQNAHSCDPLNQILELNYCATHLVMLCLETQDFMRPLIGYVIKVIIFQLDE